MASAPPPRKTRKWVECAQRLATKPGEWELVLEHEPVMHAKSVGYQSLRRAGCETTLRWHRGNEGEEDTADVWARWPIAEKTNNDGGDQ